MKNKIYITNSQSVYAVTPALRGLIKRAIGQALKYESFPYEAEVSVTLVDNSGIRELNRDYRNIDRVTDVLSFPLYEKGQIDEGAAQDGEPVSIGDIVLSLERALEQIGHGTVFLWAFKENTRACRFYEKNGFCSDGSERVSDFDGAIEVRYVRENYHG